MSRVCIGTYATKATGGTLQAQRSTYLTQTHNLRRRSDGGRYGGGGDPIGGVMDRYS